jgi:hypothetical protein
VKLTQLLGVIRAVEFPKDADANPKAARMLSRKSFICVYQLVSVRVYARTIPHAVASAGVRAFAKAFPPAFAD